MENLTTTSWTQLGSGCMMSKAIAHVNDKHISRGCKSEQPTQHFICMNLKMSIRAIAERHFANIDHRWNLHFVAFRLN